MEQNTRKEYFCVCMCVCVHACMHMYTRVHARTGREEGLDQGNSLDQSRMLLFFDLILTLTYEVSSTSSSTFQLKETETGWGKVKWLF